jgi:hypothetical protein
MGQSTPNVKRCNDWFELVGVIAEKTVRNCPKKQLFLSDFVASLKYIPVSGAWNVTFRIFGNVKVCERSFEWMVEIDLRLSGRFDFCQLNNEGKSLMRFLMMAIRVIAKSQEHSI